MAIDEMNALSLIEAKEIAEAAGEKDKEITNFIKKFIKIDKGEAKKLREELENLELMKVKEEHIAKVIDFLPEDAEDVNKIFADVSLDENEINKILEAVKKFK